MGRRPLLPVLLAGFGAVLLLIAVVSAIRTAVFLHGAARTTGTITDQTAVTTRVTGQRYPTTTLKPTVSFQTADGRWVAFTSSVSTRSAHTSPSTGWVDTTPKVHDAVPVVYDPADPNRAQVDTFFRVWALTLTFTALGGMFLLFGLVFGALASRQ